ncbi:hypothetical protein Landi51_12222 [Colletotrichum acutatum]
MSSLGQPIHAPVDECEELVDIFQSEVARLGIEEADDWHKQEFGNHEDEVGLPLKTIDDDWGDHDDKEVPQPVGVNAYGSTSGSSVERQDLGNNDPWNAVHPHAEYEVVPDYPIDEYLEARRVHTEQPTRDSKIEIISMQMPSPALPHIIVLRRPMRSKASAGKMDPDMTIICTQPPMI